MRRVRRDPKLQAQYMTEAWGVDKGRKLVLDAIDKASENTRGTYRTNQEAAYWRDVLRYFPTPPPPPPPAPPAFNVAAMDFLRANGIEGRLYRNGSTKSGWAIEIDPGQEKFVAASIIG